MHFCRRRVAGPPVRDYVMILAPACTKRRSPVLVLPDPGRCGAAIPKTHPFPRNRIKPPLDDMALVGDLRQQQQTEVSAPLMPVVKRSPCLVATVRQLLIPLPFGPDQPFLTAE